MDMQLHESRAMTATCHCYTDKIFVKKFGMLHTQNTSLLMKLIHRGRKTCPAKLGTLIIEILRPEIKEVGFIKYNSDC